MPSRFNKMITLTMDDLRYVEQEFRSGNFSKWISSQLNAKAAGLEYASALPTKTLLAMVLGRQDMEHPLRDTIVDMIQQQDDPLA